MPDVSRWDIQVGRFRITRMVGREEWRSHLPGRGLSCHQRLRWRRERRGDPAGEFGVLACHAKVATVRLDSKLRIPTL